MSENNEPAPRRSRREAARGQASRPAEPERPTPPDADSADADATPPADVTEDKKKRRFTPFRVVLLLALVVGALAAWSAYSVYKAQADLEAADNAYDELTRAYVAGDRSARDAALAEFRARAGSARDRTDGPWWGLMTKTPELGNNLSGVEKLSAAFDTVAQDGLEPLFEIVDAVADRGLAVDGQVDLDLLASFAEPVRQSRDAFAAANEELAGGDVPSYSYKLRDPYRNQAEQFAGLERALTTAATAAEVLPRMLGADDERDYLLVLQDNGTIRSTGGAPVSWARVHAEAGLVTIEEQGGPDDFPASRTNELTPDELELYGPSMARSFTDAGLTPDFPRAAELWAGHYADLHPDIPLDGVVSVDVTTLSSILQAVGVVQVDGVPLSAENVVGVLSGEAHRRLTPAKREASYATATRQVFDAVFGKTTGTYDLVLALAEAADQGRLQVAAFDDTDAKSLDGTAAVGALTADDGTTPHVDVALADDTGGAMSYYLRHQAKVGTTSCDDDGRQALAGTLTLSQDIDQADAKVLPDSVTGGGRKVEAGAQAVVVRLYAPFAGSIDSISVDGKEQKVALFGGGDRPTAALRVVVTGREPVEVTWTMTTGPGQTGWGRLGVTPGAQVTDPSSRFVTDCR